MEKITTFSQILAGYFYKRGSLDAFVRENYPYENPFSKYCKIRRYITGERVPSYLDAKDLLDLLKYDIEEAELREILKVSKEEKTTVYENDKFARRIDISYSELSKKTGIPKEDLILFLDSQLKEYNCENVKEYLTALILENIEGTYSIKNSEK